MLNAGDIMTPNPEHIESTASVQEAVNRLYELDARHLPVTDEHGELVGVLSDRDLREYEQPYEMSFEQPGMGGDEREERPVSNIMQGDVISADPEDDVSELIDIMIEHKIGAIPIVDSIEGNLVGIVSYIDILQAARDEI